MGFPAKSVHLERGGHIMTRFRKKGEIRWAAFFISVQAFYYYIIIRGQVIEKKRKEKMC